MTEPLFNSAACENLRRIWWDHGMRLAEQNTSVSRWAAQDAFDRAEQYRLMGRKAKRREFWRGLFKFSKPRKGRA